MPAVSFDAVDEVLDDTLRDFVTQLDVVLEDGSRRLRLQKLTEKHKQHTSIHLHTGPRRGGLR